MSKLWGEETGNKVVDVKSLPAVPMVLNLRKQVHCLDGM
jgi:hypothetical protein